MNVPRRPVDEVIPIATWRSRKYRGPCWLCAKPVQSSSDIICDDCKKLGYGDEHVDDYSRKVDDD